MIALLVIIYTAIVLVLFKVLRIKPTAFRIAGIFARWHPDDWWSCGRLGSLGANQQKAGDYPVRDPARSLRERTGQGDLRASQSTDE